MRRRRYSKGFESDLEIIARKRVRKIKSFFIHLIVFMMVLTIFLLKKYCNVSINLPPFIHLNWFFMAIWTFFIALQGLKLFVREVVFGQHWEKRQMDKFLESESNSQKWK